jgi:F-type H+-transporting ATPase subunit c
VLPPLEPVDQVRHRLDAMQNGYNSCFLLFAGAGIGSVFGSLVIGFARNPSMKGQLFSYTILGFALSEAMGLFCLMMAFLILFAF